MQTPEGPTSLERVVSGIVPGGVEKDPQNQHVEGWFLRTELKFALEKDWQVRGDARGGCSFFCNGILASVLPRPGLHPCEQMAVRNLMLKFAILSLPQRSNFWTLVSKERVTPGRDRDWFNLLL